MDFIKGNEQIKIDPDGINFVGNGNITIDSEKITGDISLNGKVSITDDFDITGKTNFTGDVSINGKTDFTGDVSLNGKTNFTGDVSLNGKTNFTGDVSFNKNVSISGGNITLTNGNLNIFDTNGTNKFSINESITETSTATVVVNNTRASSYYSSPLWVPSNIATDNDSTWCCAGNSYGIYDSTAPYGSKPGPAQYLYSGSGDTIAGRRTYTYHFVDFDQIDYVGTDNDKFTYGEWIQLEFSEPILFKSLKIKNYSDQSPKDIVVLGSMHGDYNPIPEVQRLTPFYKICELTAANDPNVTQTLTPSTYIVNTKFKYFRIHFTSVHSNSYCYIKYIDIVPETTIPGSITANIPVNIDSHIKIGTSYIFSDSRIKNDITIVDDTKAIDLVNTLESKEYGYIDPYNKKTQKTIGFIAQEVKDVLPNAVTIEKGFIPDEIREITNPVWNANSDGTWTLTISDIVFQVNHTGKCRFYLGETKKDIQVETDRVSFKFNRKWDNVYLWGKEINDFHMIDKNQIFALHHSAIQELSRRNDEKSAKILVLEESNEEKQQKLIALEDRISAVEKLLQETTTFQNNTQETQNTESTSLFQKV